MGIKGLNASIKKYSNFIEKNLSDYSNKTIAIDSEILVYKFQIRSYKQTEYDQNIYHLYAFLNHAISFLKNNIIPIYVFDGGAIPITKQDNCLQKRYLHREKSKVKITDLENKFMNISQKTTDFLDLDINGVGSISFADPDTLDILDQLLKARDSNPVITKEFRAECKYFLKLLGLPVLSNNGEAEVVAVKLAKNKLVDYVWSEDSDAIAYGISIEPFNEYIKILKPSDDFNKILEISSQKVLEDLSLTHNEFIDYCILSGCDYCNTIPRIGPITALKIIKEYKTIEEYLKKHPIRIDFNYVDARSVFFNPFVNDLNETSLKIGSLDQLNLRQFITIEKGKKPFHVNNIINKWSLVINEYNLLNKPPKIIEPKFKKFRYHPKLTIDMFN